MNMEEAIKWLSKQNKPSKVAVTTPPEQKIQSGYRGAVRVQAKDAQRGEWKEEKVAIAREIEAKLELERQERLQRQELQAQQQYLQLRQQELQNRVKAMSEAPVPSTLQTTSSSGSIIYRGFDAGSFVGVRRTILISEDEYRRLLAESNGIKAKTNTLEKGKESMIPMEDVLSTPRKLKFLGG